MDPISENFAWVSTYNYAENSPIANIDLWGLQMFGFGLALQAREKRKEGGQAAVDKHYKEAQKGTAAGALVGGGIGGVIVGGSFVMANPATAYLMLSENGLAMTGALWGLGTDADMPGGADDFTRLGRHTVTEAITSSSFGRNMCGPCAIIKDARLAGDYSLTEAKILQKLGKSSDNFKGLSASEIESFYGDTFSYIGGRKDFENHLKKLGPGTQGIVYGSNSDYTTLHAFNAIVDQNGAVKYADDANPHGLGHTLQTFMNNLNFLQTK